MAHAQFFEHQTDHQLVGGIVFRHQYPGSRPHWAKQYHDLPGIADKLRAVYGENLETFLRVREEAGVDPDDIFVNPFLESLLFNAPASTRHDRRHAIAV
jgi:hypothetical protein